MLATRSNYQILGHFSQLVEEIQYLCGDRQQKVAKIVHCGDYLKNISFRDYSDKALAAIIGVCKLYLDI